MLDREINFGICGNNASSFRHELPPTTLGDRQNVRLPSPKYGGHDSSLRSLAGAHRDVLPTEQCDLDPVRRSRESLGIGNARAEDRGLQNTHGM
jgi:hypothetical protein